jgi:hypothetical protein
MTKVRKARDVTCRIGITTTGPANRGFEFIGLTNRDMIEFGR